MRFEMRAIFHGQNKLKVRQETGLPVNDLEVLMPGTRYDSHDVFSPKRFQHIPDTINHQRLTGKQVGIAVVPFTAQFIKRLRPRLFRQLQNAPSPGQRDLFKLLPLQGNSHTRQRLQIGPEKNTFRIDQNAVIVPENCPDHPIGFPFFSALYTDEVIWST